MITEANQSGFPVFSAMKLLILVIIPVYLIYFLCSWWLEKREHEKCFDDEVEIMKGKKGLAFRDKERDK